MAASLNPEWNVTCRVCLQEGEIRSLFDDTCPESNLSYGAKVMQCSSVEIRRDDCLPDRICLQCIEDLRVAYRFRVNCESSDAILQSYREMGQAETAAGELDFDVRSTTSSSEIQIPISSDVLYSYKPPSGLNVKLVSREKSVLLENNGEIVICDKDDVLNEEPVGKGSPQSVATPEPECESFVDDADSLITYDDALAPSQMSQAGDVKEEDTDDEGPEERSKLIEDELTDQTPGEEDSHTVDNGHQDEGGGDGDEMKPQQHPDDSSADIFFDAEELVYVGKEDDLLNQLASIKRESDVDDWEVIYDEEDSEQYFQKIPQSKADNFDSKEFTQLPTENTKPVVTFMPPPQMGMGLMKTIQTIRKANVPNEEKPTIETVVTKPGPDGSLETVIRVKRNLKPAKQQHVCKFCNSSYKYKHALETHLRRHRGDKPYKCSECEKAFVVPFELRRHMRTHTGAKPYKCKFCERKFSDFGSKIKHERTHTGERPYVCDVCEKSFTYSHVLNSHMLIHTGVKKYACPECGKRFAKSHHLKSHRNIHVRTGVSKINLYKALLPNELPMVISHDDTSKDPGSLRIGTVVDDYDDDALVDLDQSGVIVPSHVDQLIAEVDIVDSRSNDFHLDPVVANPFGQLVNISDYMTTISTKSDPPDPTTTGSIGVIMGDDDDDDDDDVGCRVITGDVIDPSQVTTDVDDDDDPLLNVVTVLASGQVPGLVGGDYGNIQIINGLSNNDLGTLQLPAKLLTTSCFNTPMTTTFWTIH
nr:myoneurin [Aedes albopictus]